MLEHAKETPEARKFKNLQEALSAPDQEADDAELVAELLDEKGDLKGDFTLPAAYEQDVMAQQLLAHLTGYKQNYHAWRAARNSGDNARATSLFNQMRYNQLTAALIQKAYPGAKQIADELAVLQAKQTEANRRVQLAKEDDK